MAQEQWQDERDLRPPGGEYDYQEQDQQQEHYTRDRDNWDRGGGGGDRRQWRERDKGRTRSRDRSRDRRDRRSRSRSRSRHRDRDRDRDTEDDRRHRRHRSREDRHRRISQSPERDRRRPSPTGEWYCRCGSLNFKRRLVCYRAHCRAPRSEAVTPPPGGIPVESGHGLSRPRTIEDVATMAEYSANLYATTPREKLTYLQYYTDYFSKQLPGSGSDRNGFRPSDAQTETDRVNAAAAVAQSAIAQMQAKTAPAMMSAGPSRLVVDRKYPIPDTSLYIYDQTSGYYYDPTTGLYYDANTQYYYNPQTGGYLYWDPTKMNYAPCPTTAPVVAADPAPVESQSSLPVAPLPAPAPVENERPKRGDEKLEKVKIAKKIAKDMERWAKTLNQKKDSGKNSYNDVNEQNSKASVGSADIGYSVLEMRNPGGAGAPSASRPPPVPSYNGGDSSGDEDEDIIDWNKLACLLCKRQFASRDILEKHMSQSDLHRQNLQTHRDKKSEQNADRDHKYRDRAAERRSKYGGDEPPPPPRETTIFTPAPPEIGEDNVGNRLMQKMGWRAGKGLGREEQGIVGPVEAQSSTPGLGLGVKRGIYTAGPGETYSACIKKLTAARYQDLIGSEGKT